MANIQAELNAIKTAVYGEEVRSTICNALDKINNDMAAAEKIASGDKATAMEYAQAAVTAKNAAEKAQSKTETMYKDFSTKYADFTKTYPDCRDYFDSMLAAAKAVNTTTLTVQESIRQITKSWVRKEQMILNRENWSGDTYDLSGIYPFDKYWILDMHPYKNDTIYVDRTTLQQQYDAWTEAKMAQVYGENKLLAIGTTPVIDIPVEFYIIYKYDKEINETEVNI